MSATVWKDTKSKPSQPSRELELNHQKILLNPSSQAERH